MPRYMSMAAALLAVVSLCACSPTPNANTAVIVNDLRTVAKSDTVDHDAGLLDAASLPPEERLARRAWAEAEERRWREFAGILDSRRRRIERPRQFMYEPPDRRRVMIGMADAMVSLEACLEADGAWVEAWSELGHLRLVVGDRAAARDCLELALLAARHAGPADRETMLRTHRDLAWALRELAFQDQGLAAVDVGLEEFPGDEDLLLVKGLLLADAGRFTDAIRLARCLPERDIRWFDPRNGGVIERTTGWPEQWVRSQAHLAQGDPVAAFGALEEEQDDLPVDVKDLRGQGWKIGFQAVFAHERRFWNDLGLVAQLLEDPSAVQFYVASYADPIHSLYFPATLDIRSPLVFGVPDGQTPSVTSFAHGHYVAGSPWSYVALQMDLMALALFPAQRDRAAAEALAMLDVLDRRGLRPDINAALRGRILFRQEKYVEARVQLVAARDGFLGTGRVDARTSLLLGLIDLAVEDFSRSVGFLEESARADSTAAVTWRMLGVACANLERTDEALLAMNRSLGLEPRSLAGYYNRGLLQLQMRRCDAAAVDLDRAWRLAPDNEEVRRLLQTAAACVRAQNAGEEATVPQVRPGGVEAILPVPSTDMLLEHLEADLEDFFLVSPDTATATLGLSGRAARAVACMDRSDPAGARILLADHWGVDLTPLEEVVLLEAERRLAVNEHVTRLVRDALVGEVATTNPYVWALMLQEVRVDTGRYGTNAEARLLARLLDHSAEFSGRTVREWAQALRRELEEARS
ncbi:MAG: tetratricopeptide repeat protein [bacterium]|nr:tetratricopeptide repeat protein [bacterium]